jgi:hypothetical protein
VDDFV